MRRRPRRPRGPWRRSLPGGDQQAPRSREGWPVTRCSRARPVSRSITFSPASESSDPVGSSANSTFGLIASARAIATRCASPPESSPVRRAPLSARPRRPSHWAAVWYAALRRTRPSSSGSATLSAAVSSGTSCPNWNTKPNAVRRSSVRRASFIWSSRWPSKMTSPSSGRKMPARQCSSVDLPEPLGPMMARISPAAAPTLASRSAGVWPNDLTTSRASIRQPPPARTGVFIWYAPFPPAR